MEVEIFITIATISIVFFAIQCRKRRNRNQNSHLSSSCYLHLHNNHQKPQSNFKLVLADNSYSTFKHLEQTESTNSEETLNPPHPYEGEIKELIENPRSDYNFPEKEDDLNLSDSYVWVETESQLKELADALSREKAFGVDTEQHNLRSFLGFTCLIQISTQREDYLVDTIALHDKMAILRPVFADPVICKVFHGADNDVLWLQRDFHIYVVNLFDTAKACDMLSKPQRSLAYLLKTICSVATNKLLQREDWRQRPLPKEMVQYARTDAHYLLYIAKKLTAELKLQDDENSSCPDDKFHFLLEASRRSNMTCLQLYTKDVEAFPGDAAASSILSRHLKNGSGGVPLSFCDSKFQDLVRRLCAWRDLMARVHDESLRYVISDLAIVALAENRPTTLRDVYDIVEQADLNTESLNISSLLPSPSPVVCSHLEDVYQLVNSKLGNHDDIFPAIFQNCLGQNGSCPLSVFNYALLFKFKYKTNGVNKTSFKQNEVRNSKQVSRKASKDLFVKKFSRKSPLYENCRIYAKDGRVLSYCDKRRLEWYLHRNLAKVVEETPPAIILLFEPKGFRLDEGEANDFYVQSKRNVCVGCGEGNHYIRYRIIPPCYRIHFPEHLKICQSHDIVVVCVDCHETAHASAEKYKKKIAEEFGIPLLAHKVADSKENQGLPVESSESAANNEEGGVSPLELEAAAKALLRHGPRMPSKRREELTQTVMKYYGGREITEKDLERAWLVGMSPYERIKLKKKRGVSLKHYKETVPEDKPMTIKTTCVDSDTSKAKSSIEEETKQPCSATEADITTHSMNPESSEVLETQNFKGDDVDDYKDEQSTLQVKSDGNSPSLRDLKLSLGHGPHGKKVVDYLLKEFGDDGIRQFCKRWRQVFIDTVHPRFLPVGWDVQHSGEREFGDYSVHNSDKKVSVA